MVMAVAEGQKRAIIAVNKATSAATAPQKSVWAPQSAGITAAALASIETIPRVQNVLRSLVSAQSSTTTANKRSKISLNRKG